jgi:hypothetical protein
MLFLLGPDLYILPRTLRRPMLLLVLGRNAAAASGEDNEKSTLTDFQKWRGCEKNVFMYECFYTAMHARLEVKN